MTTFFKKLLRELNNINETLENRLFYEDLERQKRKIRAQNYIKLMQERLIPFERDFELTNSGILLTNEQLQERAHQRFCLAKRDGKLDDLNSIIEVQNG